VDQVFSQIAASALGDAEQPLFTPGHRLTRHEPKPGGKIRPPSENSRVANCSYQRRRVQRADARNGQEALRSLIRKRRSRTTPGARFHGISVSILLAG